MVQGESWRPTAKGMAVSLIFSLGSRFHWVLGLQITTLGQDVALQLPNLDSLTHHNNLLYESVV